MEGNEVDQLPKITDAKDQQDALETIKAIEMMRYALDEQEFKLKWSKSIYYCMDILGKMHMDLVGRLPAEVIERERMKSMPSQPIKPQVVA